jgi:hypothetical protein
VGGARLPARALRQQPFGLELAYDRKLEGEAIAERSIAEMRRVGSFTAAQADQWLALMKQAFPDVAAQDRLLGLNDGQGEVRFFHNGQPTAQTRDAEYARCSSASGWRRRPPPRAARRPAGPGALNPTPALPAP